MLWLRYREYAGAASTIHPLKLVSAPISKLPLGRFGKVTCLLLSDKCTYITSVRNDQSPFSSSMVTNAPNLKFFSRLEELILKSLLTVLTVCIPLLLAGLVLGTFMFILPPMLGSHR